MTLLFILFLIIGVLLIINISVCIQIKREFLTSKEKNHNDIDLDEYLNSLEFNTLLDHAIRPLLGHYNNKEIVDKVTTQVIKYNMSDIDNIDSEKIKNYISDVLLNYNNQFNQEEDYEFESYDNEEIIEYYNKNKLSNSDSFVDLTGTLSNFYKD